MLMKLTPWLYLRKLDILSFLFPFISKVRETAEVFWQTQNFEQKKNSFTISDNLSFKLFLNKDYVREKSNCLASILIKKLFFENYVLIICE